MKLERVSYEELSKRFTEALLEGQLAKDRIAELERYLARIDAETIEELAAYDDEIRAEERKRCESIPDTKIFTGAPPRIYCAESWTVGANKAVAAYKEAIRALGDE